MLRAATELFLGRGFEATRVSDVVRQSGGSLANLYSWFGSKRGLFAAIADDLADQIADAVDALEMPPSAPLEEALRRLGERYLELVLSPRALAWHRLAVRDGPDFPELRAATLRRGAERLQARIARLLSSLAPRGSSGATDPELAARHLCALLKSGVHLDAACGETVDRSPPAIAAQARRAVEAFLHGHGTPTAAESDANRTMTKR